MTRQEFLAAFTEMMALPPGSLTGNEQLGESGMWDSMQMLAFIAMARQKFNVTVNGALVAQAKTVDDLISLMEIGIQE